MALQLVTPDLRPRGHVVRIARLRVAHRMARRGITFPRAFASIAVVATSIAIAFTGGPVSLITPLGLFAALGAGVAFGPAAGAVSGAVMVAASVQPLAQTGAAPTAVGTWIALFPIVGVAGGLAERLRRSATMERSVAEERRRIARDLHDGVAQALAHLRLELDHMARTGTGGEKLQREADRLSRVAERALADVRYTLTDLRKTPRDLISSLGAYLEDLQGPSEPQITYDADPGARATPEVEAEIYRVAQEAVSNALRHAHASEVHVRIDLEGDMIMLSIEDDGRGIPEVRRRGVGLSSMAERAVKIGGRLSVGRRTGGGTSVSLEVRR